jgi:hypothetical protein
MNQLETLRQRESELVEKIIKWRGLRERTINGETFQAAQSNEQHYESSLASVRAEINRLREREEYVYEVKG